ncbi:hypothetical protein GN956_G24961 [Arapaima gigas]
MDEMSILWTKDHRTGLDVWSLTPRKLAGSPRRPWLPVRLTAVRSTTLQAKGSTIQLQSPDPDDGNRNVVKVPKLEARHQVRKGSGTAESCFSVVAVLVSGF